MDCYECRKPVLPKIVTGKQLYPHNRTVKDRKFWQCPHCFNAVGCHPGTNKPLGDIVGPNIKRLRRTIHQVLEPIWHTGTVSRSDIYAYLSKTLGWTYHTAKVNDEVTAHYVLQLLDTFSTTMEPIEGDF